jgi:TolB-like protein
MAKPGSDVVIKPSERITVGVLDFTLNSNDKSLEPYRRGLTDMFITELQKIPELQVVERTRLDAVMEELGTAEHDKIGPTKTGRLMGAQTLFYGSFSAFGKMMRLDGRLVRMETGKILAAGGVISATSEIDAKKIFRMVGEVSEKIAGQIKANHKMLVADNFYSKGRTAEEESDRDGAIRHYRQALQYYPDHKFSRKALERLQIQ